MKQTYDPAIRKTECGKKLYGIWVKIRRYPLCEEWKYFPTFYEWAMKSDYEVGAWLRRLDAYDPYGPTNCIWYIPGENFNYIPTSWADDWNKAVNRIRKYYGMPPLEGTKYDI